MLPIRIHYQKLIRDKIPEILDDLDIKYQVKHIKTKEDFHELLASKLVEEAREYARSTDPEELADILELIQYIMDLHQVDMDHLHYLQEKKRNDRGGYEKMIELLWTEE